MFNFVPQDLDLSTFDLNISEFPELMMEHVCDMSGDPS